MDLMNKTLEYTTLVHVKLKIRMLGVYNYFCSFCMRRDLIAQR